MGALLSTYYDHSQYYTMESVFYIA